MNDIKASFRLQRTWLLKQLATCLLTYSLEETSWFMRSIYTVNIFRAGFSVIQCHIHCVDLQSKRWLVANRMGRECLHRGKRGSSRSFCIARETINKSITILLHFSFEYRPRDSQLRTEIVQTWEPQLLGRVRSQRWSAKQTELFPVKTVASPHSLPKESHQVGPTVAGTLSSWQKRAGPGDINMPTCCKGCPVSVWPTITRLQLASRDPVCQLFSNC